MEKHFLVVILRPSIIICKYSQHVSNKTQLRIAYFDSKQVLTQKTYLIKYPANSISLIFTSLNVA